VRSTTDAGTQTLAMEDVDNNVTANGKRLHSEHGSTTTKVRLPLLLLLLLLPPSDSRLTFLTSLKPRYNEMPPAFLSARTCVQRDAKNTGPL